MSSSGTLTFISSDKPGELNPSYTLNFGANLVSYPYDGEYLILETIPVDIMPYVTNIVGEGQVAQQIPGLGWVGSLSTLEGSKGYWIVTTEPIQFQFINPDADQTTNPSNNSLKK